MSTLNNFVRLIGNVGAAPEARGKTNEGKLIVSFAIAQNVSGLDPKTRERVRKDPQWFHVSCFASLAERVLATLKKGDLIQVTGEMKAKQYKTRNGESRRAFEVIAEDILRIERLRSAEKSDPAESLDLVAPAFDEWNGLELSP
jgi:single-strand DNA-binding protein